MGELHTFQSQVRPQRQTAVLDQWMEAASEIAATLLNWRKLLVEATQQPPEQVDGLLHLTNLELTTQQLGALFDRLSDDADELIAALTAKPAEITFIRYAIAQAKTEAQYTEVQADIDALSRHYPEEAIQLQVLLEAKKNGGAT